MMNRQTMLQMVRMRDPNGLITNKQLGWYDERHIGFEASNQAFNGYLWECCLCHRKFETRHGLNMHLNSPRHQQRSYHCPNFRCGREFVSLAGLFNHLESESCAFMRSKRYRHMLGVSSIQAGPLFFSAVSSFS